MIDKDEIKNGLTIDQVGEFVADLGGEPEMHADYLIARTICHNSPGEGSYKLFYYENTHLFVCYTECGSMDIYELLIKVKSQEGIELSLPQAIRYVANYFGILLEEDFSSLREKLPDWQIFDKYEDINPVVDNKNSTFKEYDSKILKYLPRPRIIPWEQEGISYDTLKKYNISFDPINQGIVIPHYDINGKLIGIRERTIVKEAEKDGKYRPAYISGNLYNHPLGFNLYGLNQTKNTIKAVRKVVIFESEKSVLMLDTALGENNMSAACCGSNLTLQQVQLLLSLGVDEIIIAFDRQFKSIGDKEFREWTNKLTKIYKKYKNYCQISFMFDKSNILSYKASPIDEGIEKFITLFNTRIFLKEN